MIISARLIGNPISRSELRFDKDYRIFEYQVPDNDTIKLIEKYIRLTNKHERRFLFDYSALFTNGILSLPCFNNLLEAFVQSI